MSVIKKLFIFLFIVLFVTGCKPSHKLKYNGDYFDLVFNVKYAYNYQLSKNKKDFRTAREKAILISDNFKIGIEANNELSSKYKGDFDKFKKNYKNNDNYKDVRYCNIRGFRIYSRKYARYEIYLPIDDKYILRFNVYAYTNNKKSTTDVLNSKEVKLIFKYLEIKV